MPTTSASDPIIFLIELDGGFLCGSTLTGRTAYAYPSSFYASQARRQPHKVAAEMIAHENSLTYPDALASSLQDRNKDSMAVLLSHQQTSRGAA